MLMQIRYSVCAVISISEAEPDAIVWLIGAVLALGNDEWTDPSNHMGSNRHLPSHTLPERNSRVLFSMKLRETSVKPI